MDPRHHSRWPGAATALAATVIGVVLGTAGCGSGAGSGEPRASQVSTGRQPQAADSRSAKPTRSPEADSETPNAKAEKTTEPATTRPPASTSARTLPTGTTTGTEPAARPPASAAAAPVPVETTRTSTGEATTPTADVGTTTSAVPASATTSGVGPAGWFLLAVVGAALVVGVLLLYRSQRKSAWESEARALESETRAATGPPLSSLLIAGKAAQRDVSWPPLRAGLADLVSRWNVLVERAYGDDRRTWSTQVSAQLQNLIAAVDAENEAMALGDDWTVLRPRVRQAQQSLAAILAGQTPFAPPAAGEPGPPPAGEPGPPAYQS